MPNYKGYDVYLEPSLYCHNQRIAIAMKFSDPSEGELYGIITKNLVDAPISAHNCAYLDTNNMAGIDTWLQRNNYGELTGKTAQSGFCTYPEFRFKEELLCTLS